MSATEIETKGARHETSDLLAAAAIDRPRGQLIDPGLPHFRTAKELLAERAAPAETLKHLASILKDLARHQRWLQRHESRLRSLERAGGRP